MQDKKQLISKSADEKKQALFIVMVPDEPDMHGDVTSAEEIQKACHNFNLSARQANLFHIQKTSDFTFVESYCAPCDLQINGESITKGTWLANIQVHTDELWEQIKSGEISGLSIGAIALVEDIDE